jgi:hypothetical protein
MHDQRIEAGTALCGIERGHGEPAGGIRAEAVDGLGGKCDEAAGAQDGCGLFDGIRGGGEGGQTLSFRHLPPESIVKQAPAFVEGWIPATRAGMTALVLHVTTNSTAAQLVIPAERSDSRDPGLRGPAAL